MKLKTTSINNQEVQYRVRKNEIILYRNEQPFAAVVNRMGFRGVVNCTQHGGALRFMYGLSSDCKSDLGIVSHSQQWAENLDNRLRGRA